MAIRDFKPIRPVDFSRTSDILSQAGKTIESGVGDFQNVLGGLRKRDEAQTATRVKGNDQTIQSTLEGFKSLGEFNEADKAGAFNLDTLKSEFGNDFTPDTIKSSISNTKKKLLGDAVSSATNVALQTSESALDVTKGANALRDALMSQGVDADTALAESGKFMQNSQPLQARFKLEKDAQVDDAIDKVISGEMTKEEAASTVSPELSKRFYNDLISTQESQAKLNPAEKKALELQGDRDNMDISNIAQIGQQQINAKRQALANEPQAISAEVGQQFKDVQDPGKSVQDWFLNEVGSMDYKVATEKFRQLTSGGLSDQDAAALMVESYMATVDKHRGYLGNKINEDAWSAEIKRRTGTLDRQRKAKVDIANEELRLQSRIYGLRKDALYRKHGASVGKEVTGTEREPDIDKFTGQFLDRPATEDKPKPTALSEMFNKIAADKSASSTKTPPKVKASSFLDRMI